MVPNNSRQRNASRPSVPVHAPYNFVPFSEKILFRYAGMEELPPHDRIDPALHTGEIHVTLRAETPVFVSDGDEEPHFSGVRTANTRFLARLCAVWCARICRFSVMALCVPGKIWTIIRSISVKWQEPEGERAVI